MLRSSLQRGVSEITAKSPWRRDANGLTCKFIDSVSGRENPEYEWTLELMAFAEKAPPGCKSAGGEMKCCQNKSLFGRSRIPRRRVLTSVTFDDLESSLRSCQRITGSLLERASVFIYLAAVEPRDFGSRIRILKV